VVTKIDLIEFWPRARGDHPGSSSTVAMIA